MSYHTVTLASGYRALTAPQPSIHDDYAAYRAWHDRHYVNTLRRGRWAPDRIAAALRKSGVVGDITVTVTTLDLNGRGRGGHDARWLVTQSGAVTPLAITAEEQEAEAAMQDADVWEDR